MLPPKAIPDTANRIFYPEELEEPKKKLASELPEESNPNSRYYEDREQDDEWVTARADWEASNPKEEREAWKDAFSKGEIDSLPWETHQTLITTIALAKVINKMQSKATVHFLTNYLKNRF